MDVATATEKQKKTYIYKLVNVAVGADETEDTLTPRLVLFNSSHVNGIL